MSRRTPFILLKLLFIVPLVLILLSLSTRKPADTYQLVQDFTGRLEFDFIDWTLDALWTKNMQEAVKAPRYMNIEEQRDLVFEYLDLVRRVNNETAEVNLIYADPDIENPGEVAAERSRQLYLLRQMEARLRPIAESVIQQQISTVLAELNLSVAGQPIPPVMYHVTRLPNALIVSPRSVIRQDVNISLIPEMSSEQIAELEQQVEEKLDVSALVVPIGGVGTYPTMVMSTTNLPWLLEVVSHEWIHNYLTLRPLGMQYMVSGEMRTINETTANLAGKEIGAIVLQRYYPELAPPTPTPTAKAEAEKPAQPAPTPTLEDPNVFNYRRAMRETRQTVDAMLAEGKIEEAEAYMETRRRLFYENGYLIRRLNQAYFAFYGAYNDEPGGGAGGTDPVGPAVQELRRRSSSLADFLNRIAMISSFEDLQRLLQ